MKSNERKINLEGTSAEIAGNLVRIKGAKGAIERGFKEKSISISSNGREISVKAADEKRKCKRIMCSVAAHIRGMVTDSDIFISDFLGIPYHIFNLSLSI